MSIPTLREDQFDQVAWLTVERFSQHVEYLASQGVGEVAGLAAVVAPVLRGDADAADGGLLGQLLYESTKLMDGFDEEPVGPSYYPFKVAELIAMSAQFLLGTPRNVKAFSILVEWLGRFAGHLDWQMKKSRIWPDDPAQFARAEEMLRFAFGRLTGLRDAAYATSRDEALESAALQIAALRCCLSRESSCQFVVIANMTPDELMATGRFTPTSHQSDDESDGVSLSFSGAGTTARLHVTTKPVIYFHTSADHFDRPDRSTLFIHVWDSDPDAICELVDVLGENARYVDRRDPSGAVIEAARYRELMSPSVDKWK